MRGAWVAVIGNWQQPTESIWSWSSYNYMRSCPRTHCDHTMFIWPLKQIRKVKKLDKCMPYEQTTNCKNHHLISSSIILMQQQWTISQSDCDVKLKVDLYDSQQWLKKWLDWEETLKHFPKQNLHQKQGVMATVSCQCDPLQLSESLVKLLPLRSMLSKSIRCTENWNAWSQCWLTGRDQFFFTMPDSPSHNQHFKSLMNWARKFYIICHIHLTSH